MPTVWRASVVLVAVLASPAVSAQAQQAVTAADRAEIQALVTGYAKALSGCAATDFADLFAPGTGYFASGFRGQVVGRDRLIALVESERHCFAPPAAGAAPRPGGTAPTVVVEATPAGVRGTVDLGGAGQYEDAYLKVAAGWRFASRHVLTPAEKKAGLSARDMIQIRQLAGGPDDFGDVYPAGPDGVKRLRSSGVAIGVSANGITGRAALKDDGGSYDDLYMKSADGRWRFASRVFTTEAAPAAQAPRPATVALTALDYFEIGQLASKYARFIDTCSNNGYDYADLFAADGYFAPEQNGTIGRKFQGREQLAAVSGGGTNGCKNVGWIVQGVKHLYVNHIIAPSADGGATGTVDMLMIGLNGDPLKIRHEGYYEDTYVKTAQGWRFTSRIHHVPQGGTVGTATAK